MQVKPILHIFGLLLMLFSLTMVPPLLVWQLYQDGAVTPFSGAFLATFTTGFVMWVIFRRYRQELKTRDGFFLVALTWTALSAFGALPFYIAEFPAISFTDSVFETVSGLTATGVTVLSGLDHLPHALQYYRQQLQFFGGMGVVLLAVAVLPMLGVGGMQLYRAEVPGPSKDEKLTPRIAETAKRLWLIYVGLTVACALFYWVGGMTFFDAIGESYATIATGGFSIHDANFAYYNSPFLEITCTIFMILGAANFSLHYLFLQTGKWRSYWRDIEFRGFIYIMVVIVLVVVATLIVDKVYPDVMTDIVKGVFTVVSLATTTGFTSGDFSGWPTFVPFLIMFVALIGGCAGSTAGGMKVVRMVLLQKQGKREMQRLIHPQAILPIKFGEQLLPEKVANAIWGFVAVFGLVFVILLLILLATGLDITTAFGGLAACISNAGAAIGKVSVTFEALPATAKWTFVVAMVVGRLEVFPILILFTASFWRR